MQVETFGYWFPESAQRGKHAEPGCIVAYDFKPWLVVDMRHGVKHKDHPDLTYTVYRLRPVDATAADDADRDIHRGWHGYLGPTVLREHYGLCIHCNELLPCREVMAERAAIDAQKRMARYETPGICPACAEPVTHRQESETLPNMVVPLGPPVTFHAGRKMCRRELGKYRDNVGQPESQLRLDGGE